MNPLAEIIRREILSAGAVAFSRFMELALYCPQLGYYEQKRDTAGRRGDFYTSVSVGPLFGEMLAFQFAGWLEEFKIKNSKLNIVEAGAHDGKLAADILRWLRERRPSLFERLEYVILEPSAVRREWQRAALEKFAPRVRWPDHQLSAAARRLSGVFFSNELLDAFPVRRLGWDARDKKWFEWGVAVAGENFIWRRMPGGFPVSAFRFQVPAELLEVLPDGYSIETSPAAEAWWRRAATSLGAGKLLAIDYGLTDAELFQPGRPGGTLRAYRRHRAADDLLASAGDQDLTAHVNFTALQNAGESAGLKTEGLLTQAEFLTPIAGRAWKNPAAFGGWTSAQTRQFQTLTHPDHLGRAFRVLVQAKNPDETAAGGI